MSISIGKRQLGHKNPIPAGPQFENFRTLFPDGMPTPPEVPSSISAVDPKRGGKGKSDNTAVNGLLDRFVGLDPLPQDYLLDLYLCHGTGQWLLSIRMETVPVNAWEAVLPVREQPDVEIARVGWYPVAMGVRLGARWADPDEIRIRAVKENSVRINRAIELMKRPTLKVLRAWLTDKDPAVAQFGRRMVKLRPKAKP